MLFVLAVAYTKVHFRLTHFAYRRREIEAFQLELMKKQMERWEDNAFRMQ